MSDQTYGQVAEMSEGQHQIKEERGRISGLLGFAEEILTARAKVQMEMQSGLGVFHEADFECLEGVTFDCDDGAWLRIKRLRETKPPEPPEHVAAFLKGAPSDPNKTPVLRSAISIEVPIEEASDLVEGELLMPDDCHPIVEDGIEIEGRVKVTLHAENCVEMRRDFEAYVGGPWAAWAQQEKPVRRTQALYNDLFKINSAIHTSEGTPPELVWGIGIGRWRVGTARIDMPLIEQSLDIEVESGGSIAIRLRDISPNLSLKPYIELDIDGTPKLQRTLQADFERLLQGDIEFSPFTTIWEPLLDTAVANIVSDGVHVSREALDGGETLRSASETLRVTSSWAIFGRPRANEFRVQDIQKLRAEVENDSIEVPPPIRGFTAQPKEEAPKDISSFGLDSAVLVGAAQNNWEPSFSGDVGATPRVEKDTKKDADRKASAKPTSKVHFFPLPFNEEQGRISDMIDDKALDVVCVSGPPGTGKSHTIANIISHEMAMGKRVLVTARTPEAIAAVRAKLPERLQSLVIASVGTDRDSAQQLQEAVTELSGEVVGLDINEAQAERARLEQEIIDCDAKIRDTDRELAKIARANLTQIEWNEARHSPMELVEILAKGEPEHGWFTDRPSKQPPAQLDEVLQRLIETLPELAPDIIYAGARLPAQEALPSTAGIVEAHVKDLAWNTRETVDYSSAPTMALDAAGGEEQARSVLRELDNLHEKLCSVQPSVKAFAIRALDSEGPISRPDLEALSTSIATIHNLSGIEKVRFDLGQCGPDEFSNAAARGAAGKNPVGFGVFNGKLKAAVATVKVDGKEPAGSGDWQSVLDACRLNRDRHSIDNNLARFRSECLIDEQPRKPWELASQLLRVHGEMDAALAIVTRMKPVVDALRPLFPYGLDLDEMCRTLDCEPAFFALRGNLPEKYEAPKALLDLRAAAGDGNLPILGALTSLADAIGREDTNPNDLVQARAEITREIERLSEVSERLKRLGADLDMLAECGAPDWAERLRQAPDHARDLIPDGWRSSWSWGLMKTRIDRIVDLGNGDEHRKRKAGAMKLRGKALESLIRVRTLIGLKGRMTKPIRQAMEAFTQAVSKIGAGKGKKAPRYIRAAQQAARQASNAAPVWIMPEYKIPEQLPAKFGDFDLVILDEASQSDITALSALARGKKILVVGDEKQVSPSVVGITTQKVNALRAEYLDNLPSADLIDENSSIFEITKRMHPESHLMLREHFRCVGAIINFSTRFYNKALVPLRVPKASERFDPPLVDVYLPNATRDGSTNEDEARWIVDEIAKIVADPQHEHRDIGVISLIGAAQADKIGRMMMEDPRIGPENIAARNIIFGDARTMQGQERSIVFLSMVATPDKVHAQTRKEDQQRYNVAMSRAQDRLYLVRSVGLEDLNSNDIKAEVLQHFVDPMPEGRSATKGEVQDLMERCDSGFEREVLKRLMDANYRVRPQVSAGRFNIDLVVEGKDDRRLAIELDGDAFHGPEVWDRDMTRQAALERAGWIFWRVFGSQWNANKDYWWRNLIETLDSLGIEPIGAAAVDDRFTETIVVERQDDWEEKITAEEDDAEEVLPEQEKMEARSPAHEETSAEKESADPDEENKQVSLPFEAGPSETTSPAPAPAKTGEKPQARVGSRVRLEKLGNGGGKMVVTLVSQDGHDADNGMLGVHTPLGQALLDATPGDQVEYQVGAYVHEVRVLELE